jgi:hypothetical protein
MYLIFSWYDGFSTFHVNAAGEVVKHVADKVKLGLFTIFTFLLTLSCR